MKRHEIAHELRELADRVECSISCGNNPCIVAQARGLHTNGACRCELLLRDVRRDLLQLRREEDAG